MEEGWNKDLQFPSLIPTRPLFSQYIPQIQYYNNKQILFL